MLAGGATRAPKGLSKSLQRLHRSLSMRSLRNVFGMKETNDCKTSPGICHPVRIIEIVSATSVGLHIILCVTFGRFGRCSKTNILAHELWLAWSQNLSRPMDALRVSQSAQFARKCGRPSASSIILKTLPREKEAAVTRQNPPKVSPITGQE